RGIDRRRERHSRQRDRESVGPLDLSRDNAQPRAAWHAGRDVARRHRRRPGGRVRAGRAWRRSWPHPGRGASCCGRRGHLRRPCRKRAGRDARGTGYSEQRHAECREHRGRRRRGVGAGVIQAPGARRQEPGTLRTYIDLARPFTLVAPALGFMSGALTAIGAAPREPWRLGLLTAPLVGSAMAALLNAGNNALNQIYDLEIDRVNKPKRPLPSGRLTTAQVWLFTN